MARGLVWYLLNLALLVAALVVVLTGLLVDQLDLNDFAPHRWSGYAVAVLITVHLVLHRRGLRIPRHRRRMSATAVAVPRETSSVRVDSPPDLVRAPAGGPSVGRRAALVGMGTGVLGAVGGWWGRTQVSPVPYEGGDVGLFYHRESSTGLLDLMGDVVDWGPRPAQYRSVDGLCIELPAPSAPSQLSVAQALAQRRSLREYADRELTSAELAWLLYAAAGHTRDGRRTAPSAGALYPIETYAAVRAVSGIPPGLYHLDVRGHREVRGPALARVREGSVAGDLMLAGLGQQFLRDAPVVLVLTGVFQRSRWKYHARHYRFVCWEGGHIAQNLYLAAESAGLGACMVGSFLDGRLNRLLEVDGRREAALGLIAVGAR